MDFLHYYDDIVGMHNGDDLRAFVSSSDAWQWKKMMEKFQN